MPAIRDVAYSFETLTTDAGITADVPTNQANDLLYAFVMGDTGAPTWTPPSGWTQHLAQKNTCSFATFYKVSNGSEPTSVSFGATVNETYNATIVSIRDIDTTNPFGSPSVTSITTQAAAAKFNMQTITTNRANSLVLVASASSGATVPSFIEGQAHSLSAADGSAESMGIGWFFMPTAGTTPSTISCSNVGTTGAGVKAVIQIAAPSTGATVIPPYIASDLCSYLDPISGITAYNTNTAIAATADTNFGTSLGGKTAADATVASALDTGINSFHSTGQITTVANATNIYGAELVFATGNRPDVTGRNVLCHVQASTPTMLQRLTNIASTKGIWFGMRSGTATNYKIWQVGGSDMPNAAGRPIPVIINEGAGNTKATAGTLSPSSILAFGFWLGAKIVNVSSWQFMSLWLMDTTAIAGGNSSEPMGIEGIVKTISDSHERKSALLQGKNQMLLLQDLQIGDGGTSPTYLDLDSTAIELPSQYNATTKQVIYNSVDNKIGITYYAGASDTIKHRNSVISSPSRYKWGLHDSSSTSATYDFSGLAVIGAGTITLNKAIVISGLTINDYSSISANDVIFSECSFKKPPSTSGSVTVSAATIFDQCTVDTSTVTSGNYWISVPDLEQFTNTSFTGGGGHAIRITTPGTYAFSGNTFSGYGANGSGGAAIFNDSGGAVTINITGGGSTPTYKNGTGASTSVVNAVNLTITGLQDGSDISILEAGTTVEVVNVQENTGTTYNYSYDTSGIDVDIGIFKAGYRPLYIRGYTLGASDSSLPVSQEVDRAYLT